MRHLSAEWLLPNYVEIVKRPASHIKGALAQTTTDDGRSALDYLEPQEKVFLALVDNYAPHLSEFANAVFNNIVARRTHGA